MQVNQLQKSQPKENRQNSYLTDKDGNPLMFGNLDKKNEFAFRVDFSDHYVIRHSKVEVLASSARVEDPLSVQYQFYDLYTYKKMSAQPVSRTGVQKASEFDRTGLTVTVLHDPTIVN